MTSLTDQIAEARATLSRLERAAAAAPCAEVGHTWKLFGGANCGCENGDCSVPVNTCTRCGDCDYGESEEADQIRTRCGGPTG